MEIQTGYSHSFGITNSMKLILIETPFCMNLIGVIAGGRTKRSYSDWLKWNADQKTRFYVINLDDGKVSDAIYETEKLLLFHHINAYEDGNPQLVVDVAGYCGYNDAEWVCQMDLKDTSKLAALSPESSARRYVLPLNIKNASPQVNLLKHDKTFTTASATLRRKTTRAKTYINLITHHLTSSNIELPRINYEYNGTRYTFFYGLHRTKQMDTCDFGIGVVNFDTASKFNSLMCVYSYFCTNNKPTCSRNLLCSKISKVNVKTRQIIYWTATDEDGLASKPVFVPNPVELNSEEDDGVILSTLLTKTKLNSVSLLILNAKEMKEIGRVEFTTLGIVTGTSHGSWTQAGQNIYTF